MAERQHPLSNHDAKALIVELLDAGRPVVWTRHAAEQAAKRGIPQALAQRALRAGVCEGSEEENGSWRYRVRGLGVVLIVSFGADADGELIVVVTVFPDDRGGRRRR